MTCKVSIPTQCNGGRMIRFRGVTASRQRPEMRQGLFRTIYRPVQEGTIRGGFDTDKNFGGKLYTHNLKS